MIQANNILWNYKSYIIPQKKKIPRENILKSYIIATISNKITSYSGAIAHKNASLFKNHSKIERYIIQTSIFIGTPPQNQSSFLLAYTIHPLNNQIEWTRQINPELL